MEVLFVTLISVFVFIIALLATIVISLPVPKPWSLLWSILNEPSPTLEPKPNTKKKSIDIRC